jgi:hypothetical protein
MDPDPDPGGPKNCSFFARIFAKCLTIQKTFDNFYICVKNKKNSFYGDIFEASFVFFT